MYPPVTQFKTRELKLDRELGRDPEPCRPAASGRIRSRLAARLPWTRSVR